MDFSIPWQPSLNGNDLNKCAILRDYMVNGERPSIQNPDDKLWMAGAIEGELQGAGTVKGAIQESVVMIWCLKMTQESGVNDPDWQNHLIPWMVRIVDSAGFLMLISRFSDETSGSLQVGRDKASEGHCHWGQGTLYPLGTY
jgi:hypothetical protein